MISDCIMVPVDLPVICTVKVPKSLQKLLFSKNYQEYNTGTSTVTQRLTRPEDLQATLSVCTK